MRVENLLDEPIVGILPFQILGVIAYSICRKMDLALAKLIHLLVPPVTFLIFVAGHAAYFTSDSAEGTWLTGPLLLFFVLAIGIFLNTLGSIIATFFTIRFFND